MALSNVFHSLLNKRNIISISGESGTGKTTLALYLIGHLLTSRRSYKDSGIWVQASEKFPKKRLLTLFQYNKEILTYLKHHIFIIPKNNVCRTYQELNIILQHFSNGNSLLPPGVKYIVIDNISYHLRFALSCRPSVSEKLSLLDNFYEEGLLPLIMYCQRETIYLVLLHEVSFNPDQNEQKTFLSKLYDRLDFIHVELKNVFNHAYKKITIKSGSITQTFNYKLCANGFLFK